MAPGEEIDATVHAPPASPSLNARVTKAVDGVPGDNPRMTPGPSCLVRTILFASFAWHAAIRDAKIPQLESGSSR